MDWTSRIPVVGLLLLQTVVGQTTAIDHWETVLYADTVWSYFIGTTEPDTNWRHLTFDDSAWSRGVGGIGYGDGDDNTVIEPCISLYMRITFSIYDTTVIEKALLHIDYDDAFVAYINNIEVTRANIGVVGDHPPHDQPADGLHEAQMYEGLVPSTFPIEKDRLEGCLNQGDNVLALQVHNESIESSDLSSTTFLSVGITDDSFTYYTPPDWFSPPFLFESSNLPIVVINTNGQEIPDAPRIIAHMSAIYHEDGSRHFIDEPYNNYDGRISIEIRGSSTQMFPKKAYALETQDTMGENLNISLLGLPAENDWILYAPYSDKSLMRNVLAFKLGRDMGWYNPRTRFCELVLNGDYQGVYVLIEKIKIDQNRLDLAALRPEDISGDELTGGYVVKVDWGGEGWDSHDKRFVYHHPQADRLQPKQKRYIRDYITNFESVLESANYQDKTEGYYQYLDVSSFIDFILANELAKNVDGMRISTFMYKDKDSNGGKLVLGPLWDFNLAFGNMAEGVFWNSRGWSRGNELDPTLFWWDRMMEDEQFVTLQKQRWEELRAGVLRTDVVLAFIDSTAEYLQEAQERNFRRWPILGEYVWDNPFWGDTYQEDVDYMKDWIAERFNWIDRNIPEGTIPVDLPPISTSVNVYPNPFQSGATFEYELNSNAYVLIKVYDLLGRVINTVANRFHPEEGTYSSVWLGVDRHGKEVATGLYLYTVEVNHKLLSRNKIIKYHAGN